MHIHDHHENCKHQAGLFVPVDLDKELSRVIALFRDPENITRLASNDNKPVAATPIKSTFKRLIIAAYCWGLMSVSRAQTAIDRAKAWEA